jgi:flavin reductase (DIM6/NTAB) family NADH-FMN oxidoreductase RutF
MPKEESSMKTEYVQHQAQLIQPKILYYGTPVILLTTWNEDGTSNISPLSSSWALGNRIVLGMGLQGKALENVQRHPECVVNIPGPSLWRQVEALAPLTGRNPVPEFKRQIGFRYEKEKFAASGLTAVASEKVKPHRIAECPLQIEATVQHIRISESAVPFAIVEVEAVNVWAHREIILDESRIDPAKWSPLIYNFRHYFGLGEELGKTFRAET